MTTHLRLLAYTSLLTATGLTISTMTTKERLHRLVDELSDREAEDTLRLLDDTLQHERGGAAPGGSQMATLPDGWGQTLTGEPMPDVAAAVRRSREMH
jgi:hypothetical protein